MVLHGTDCRSETARVRAIGGAFIGCSDPRESGPATDGSRLPRLGPGFAGKQPAPAGVLAGKPRNPGGQGENDETPTHSSRRRPAHAARERLRLGLVHLDSERRRDDPGLDHPVHTRDHDDHDGHDGVTPKAKPKPKRHAHAKPTAHKAAATAAATVHTTTSAPPPPPTTTHAATTHTTPPPPPPTRTTHTTPPPPPPTTTQHTTTASSGAGCIPQGGGGDDDSDNHGGPSDGDGCL